MDLCRNRHDLGFADPNGTINMLPRATIVNSFGQDASGLAFGFCVPYRRRYSGRWKAREGKQRKQRENDARCASPGMAASLSSRKTNGPCPGHSTSQKRPNARIPSRRLALSAATI